MSQSPPYPPEATFVCVPVSWRMLEEYPEACGSSDGCPACDTVVPADHPFEYNRERTTEMSRSMRALILQVAMLLLAAPVLANADPRPVGNADAGRSANAYAKADDVDCSKLDDDDAREKCREKKVDRKTDDANVDCSKINDDEARRRCLGRRSRTDAHALHRRLTFAPPRPASLTVRRRFESCRGRQHCSRNRGGAARTSIARTSNSGTSRRTRARDASASATTCSGSPPHPIPARITSRFALTSVTLHRTPPSSTLIDGAAGSLPLSLRTICGWARSRAGGMGVLQVASG